MRKLSAEHIKKLVEGRKKYIAHHYGVVCTIADDLNVRSAGKSFTVQHGNQETCHSTLESALQEAFNISVMSKISESKQKELSDVLSAIAKVREQISEITTSTRRIKLR
jgi:hypothetical protein